MPDGDSLSSRGSVSDGLHKLDNPRHIVIYRCVGDSIHIVRLLHDAMDLMALSDS